jgi:hypothetical protein
VTSDGQLYTWGKGEDGALGLGDAEDKSTPTRVMGALRGKRVVAIAAGGDAHAAALTSEVGLLVHVVGPLCEEEEDVILWILSRESSCDPQLGFSHMNPADPKLESAWFQPP